MAVFVTQYLDLVNPIPPPQTAVTTYVNAFFDSHIQKPRPQHTVQLFTPFGNVPTAVTPQGWQGVKTDFVFQRPVKASLMKFDMWTPGVFSIPSNTTTWGWQPLYPALYAPKVKASEQPFSSWQPIGNVPSPVTPQGWWPCLPDRVFAPRKPVWIQVDLPEMPAPNVVFPDGWRGMQFDYKFQYPVKASMQKFDMWTPLVLIMATTPATLPAVEFQSAHIKPLSAALQQFAMWTPPEVLIPGQALRNVILPLDTLKREE